MDVKTDNNEYYCENNNFTWSVLLSTVVKMSKTQVERRRRKVVNKKLFLDWS